MKFHFLDYNKFHFYKKLTGTRYIIDFKSKLAPMELQPDPKKLIELAHAKMYFGKYKGRYLSELPEYYLLWFRQKGFPNGKTGLQMQQVMELKVNGMADMLRTIRKKYPKKDVGQQDI